MDGQMTLDICRRKVYRASSAEMDRLGKLMEKRYREEIAEKLMLIDRRYEREKLRPATECVGQMELEDFIC